jgi:tripeptide aminopeptidase
MEKQFLENADRTVMELLAIPGVSAREGRVMEYIARRLRQAGAPISSISFDGAHRKSPYGGEVGNLICTLPGIKHLPRRLLMAHVDTVPLCQGARPLREGNMIVPAGERTGLGADDRSGSAVILATALEILRRKLPHPPLTFFWTVQEELGLYGARYARLGLLRRPKLAFNFDGGSAERIVVGATGGYHIEIHIQGIASHAGASPESGVSAITIAAVAIAQLQETGWLGRIEKRGRRGTSNVGAIRGGEATNIVAPQVEIRAEARSHDSAFRMKIVRSIERAFLKAAKSIRNCEGVGGEISHSGRLDYEAFKLPADDPSILAAEAAIRDCGGDPLRAVSDGGLDANWMTARSIPTVTLGCGQRNPHTPAERLDLSEFHKACRVALRLATANQ